MSGDWAGGSFGLNEGWKIVPSVTTIVCEAADHHRRIGAQSQKLRQDERLFLEAGGKNLGEAAGFGKTLGMSMQRQGPAGGSGGTMANQEDGCPSRVDTAFGAGLGSQVGSDARDAGVQPDGRTENNVRRGRCADPEGTRHRDAGKVTILHETRYDAYLATSKFREGLGRRRATVQHRDRDTRKSASGADRIGVAAQGLPGIWIAGRAMTNEQQSLIWKQK